jgi:hypothetical protein
MTSQLLQEEKKFLHSYLTLRRWIGIIGIALPIFLVLATVLRGRDLLSSISGYYYSDLRDVFVGCMCATGVFLIFYKGVGKVDNWWSTAAGMMAILLAVFPTRPADNPTQWEKYVGYAHIAFSAAFFLILAVFCIFRFTRSERSPVPDPQRKSLRNAIYKGCGYTILLALALILIFGAVFEEQSRAWHPALWFEALAIFAFGTAWLIKGQTLFPDRTG